MSELTSFSFSGNVQPVVYVETQTVKEGVVCDVYALPGDNSKDLAIVRVAKGYKTPLQRIESGKRTIEGHVEGIGMLAVRSIDGQIKRHMFGPSENNEPIIVGVGEAMQWTAETDLIFYEVCEPPYQDGRFKDFPGESL